MSRKSDTKKNPNTSFQASEAFAAADSDIAVQSSDEILLKITSTKPQDRRGCISTSLVSYLTQRSRSSYGIIGNIGDSCTTKMPCVDKIHEIRRLGSVAEAEGKYQVFAAMEA